MSEDAQQHGRHDREGDYRFPWQATIRLQEDETQHDRGEPRGPNQPMKSTVCARKAVPLSATATGTMRMSVKLMTA